MVELPDFGCRTSKGREIQMSCFWDIDCITKNEVICCIALRTRVQRSSANQMPLCNESMMSTNCHDNLVECFWKMMQEQLFTLKTFLCLFASAARNHVNRMCLAADVPLIESGSGGYLGQVSTIKKVMLPKMIIHL